MAEDKSLTQRAREYYCEHSVRLSIVELMANFAEKQLAEARAEGMRDALQKRIYCPNCMTEFKPVSGDIVSQNVPPSAESASAGVAQDKPLIVCLCGSTRFYKEFQIANFQETMKGRIVLSVGFYAHAQGHEWHVAEHGQHVGINDEEKAKLDELHKRKIDLADDVYVLNVGGYIGSSTRSEINYAMAHGKPVRYLEIEMLERMAK